MDNQPLKFKTAADSQINLTDKAKEHAAVASSVAQCVEDSKIVMAR